MLGRWVFGGPRNGCGAGRAWGSLRAPARAPQALGQRRRCRLFPAMPAGRCGPAQAQPKFSRPPELNRNSVVKIVLGTEKLCAAAWAAQAVENP